MTLCWNSNWNFRISRRNCCIWHCHKILKFITDTKFLTFKKFVIVKKFLTVEKFIISVNFSNVELFWKFLSIMNYMSLWELWYFVPNWIISRRKLNSFVKKQWFYFKTPDTTIEIFIFVTIFLKWSHCGSNFLICMVKDINKILSHVS